MWTRQSYRGLVLEYWSGGTFSSPSTSVSPAPLNCRSRASCSLYQSPRNYPPVRETGMLSFHPSPPPPPPRGSWSFEYLCRPMLISFHRPCAGTPWPEMEKVKTFANSVRNRLDEKDIGRWNQHTQFTKLTGFVVRELRQRVQPELCTGAWY